jgi:acyl-CoA reductase-like NAD-dependent aldehyde dehydrogenase
MNDDPGVDWAALAANADRSVAPRIGGKVEAATGNRIELIDPADGSGGLDYAAASETQVDAAVQSARKPSAGAQWWSMPAMARRDCLLKLADLMQANAAEIAIHDCLDIGKPISAAAMEVHIAASMCRHFGELADKLYSGQLAPSDPGSMAMHVRKPRGVVGAIVPWNYPVINATLKLAPALAAGNSVVLKPSELSPGSAGVLARLCDEAGLPPGTVNCVPGDAVTGAALAHHPGVDMLTFTGSTATGKALMRAAGESSIKPLLLECGGKSPELVFEDVRSLGVEAIAAAIVAGAMANQGQLCVARSRLYVQESLYSDLLAAISAVLEQTTPGHPLDPATTFGPLASPTQAQRVREYIDSGIKDGATVVFDGRGCSVPNKDGCYVAPTLFCDVASSMRIVREEIFGPVLAVSSFATEDEAVRLANSSEFGLAATVWTSDLARSQRLMNQIETGGLLIRSTAEQRFGAGWGREGEPYKQSGYGIEGGQMGVYSYTRLQSIQVDFPLEAN